MLRGQGSAARMVEFKSCWRDRECPYTVKFASCQDGKLQLALFVNLSWLELYFEVKWRRTCNLPRVRSWMERVVTATYLIKKIYSFLHPSWQSSRLPRLTNMSSCVKTCNCSLSNQRLTLCLASSPQFREARDRTGALVLSENVMISPRQKSGTVFSFLPLFSFLSLHHLLQSVLSMDHSDNCRPPYEKLSQLQHGYSLKSFATAPPCCRLSMALGRPTRSFVLHVSFYHRLWKENE